MKLFYKLRHCKLSSIKRMEFPRCAGIERIQEMMEGSKKSDIALLNFLKTAISLGNFSVVQLNAMIKKCFYITLNTHTDTI